MAFKNSWKNIKSHTEILDEVDKLLKNYNYDFNIDIVITGGEPLLYWNDLEFQKL